MYQLDQSFTRLRPGIDFSEVRPVPGKPSEGSACDWCILGQPPQSLRTLHWPALINAWHERLVKALCEPAQVENHQGLRRVQVLGDVIFERIDGALVQAWNWIFDENDSPQLKQLPDSTVAAVGVPYGDLWLGNYRRGALRTLLAQHPSQKAQCSDYIDWAGKALQVICWTEEVQAQVRTRIAEALDLNPKWLQIATEVTRPECSNEPLRLDHYNHVAIFFEEYEILAQENPQLIALFALLSSELYPDGMPAMEMKSLLNHSGVGSAMWRLVTRCGTRWILEHLDCFDLRRTTLAHCAWDILSLAQTFGTQQLVPKELLSALMHLAGNPNCRQSSYADKVDDMFDLCKRLGIILTRADEPTRQLLLDQAEPLLAWFEAHSKEISPRALRHMTLAGMLKRMRLQQKKDELNAQAQPAWQMPYRVDLQDTEVQAVVLDSAFAVWQEGQSMRHCVDKYTAMCAKGELLIVSLRRPGQSHGFATASFDLRGATIELHRYSGFANQALQPPDFDWIKRCQRQLQVQHEVVLTQRQAQRWAARREARLLQSQAVRRCGQHDSSEAVVLAGDTPKVMREETATIASKPIVSKPGVDMKTEICRHGGFRRVVALEPIAAVPGQFALTFGSLLDSSRDPHAERRNFSAVLSQADVQALRELLDGVINLQGELS